MFDNQLRPIYQGRVLVNKTAMQDPAVKAALEAMSKRNFEPQEINRYGVWYISAVSYTHLTLPTIYSV